MDQTFEYLTVINGEIYTKHIDFKPATVRNILFIFRILKDRYSATQVKYITKYLESMAESTIEIILKDKLNKCQKKNKFKSRRM